MLVYPREVLQNRLLHNEGTKMQDKSAPAAGRLLRVAASFNNPVQRTCSRLPRLGSFAMGKLLTFIAGLLCIASVCAQGIPDQLVGVWATEGSAFEREALIGGEALYLDRTGSGAMVGAPLPVNRCPDGRVCTPIIGFKVKVTLAGNGKTLRMRVTEKNESKELVATYNEQEKSIQGPSEEILFRRSTDIPANIKAMLNANP